jgi:radical SAM protein with 4Fe4S-binding SPASM domain
MGVRHIGLHLLEIESNAMRAKYALSDAESLWALMKLRSIREELPTVSFSLFGDLDGLLMGKNATARCIWQACDPYTTPSVRGIGARGERTKCSRVNKEGIDFVPSSIRGYERYIALYYTPQEAGGCQGCRFFLACRGQCPGTAINGDWRNRSEQCQSWKQAFEAIENELLEAGRTPISLNSERLLIEEATVHFWEEGRNLPVEQVINHIAESTGRPNALSAVAHAETVVGVAPRTTEIPAVLSPNLPDPLPFQLSSFSRLAWVSNEAQRVWEPIFAKIRAAVVRSDWMSVAVRLRDIALVRVSPDERGALIESWRYHDLVAEPIESVDLHRSAFLYDACSPSNRDGTLFAVSQKNTLKHFFNALRHEDHQAISDLLGYPACCGMALRKWMISGSLRDTTWAMGGLDSPGADFRRELEVSGHFSTNPFFRPLGVRAVAHRPCSFHCADTAAVALEVRQVFEQYGSSGEHLYRLLQSILSWSAEWSALHGIAELKSPILKLSSPTDATAGKYAIKWSGRNFPIEGGRGLQFPYRQGHSELFTILESGRT